MIRKANLQELQELLSIYNAARAFMTSVGNSTQWGDNYPSPALLKEDIFEERLYVVCGQDRRPHGAFVFLLGDDPTYAVIDGAWQNDAPYGTIHRLASDGTTPRVFETCLNFCREICPNIRADTHKNNHIMRHLLEKHGFVRCGTIHLGKISGDSLRTAYHLPAQPVEGNGEIL